ncbi:Fic family protein [Phocaeicola sp.]
MFIHETDNWPYFRWDNDKITDLLARTNKAIGFLAGRLSAIGFDHQMAATVEAVTHDVVSSSEIEGVTLNTSEVRSSVARRLGVTVPETKEPTHYVDGVVEMMLDATQNYSVPLTAERLFGWHTALFPFGKSGSSTISVGAYRMGGMEVISGMFGRERIHYRAPEADRVSEEMDAFLLWFNDAECAPSLLKSAIAHLRFVSIHPFDDGNGRIGRAISDMVLSQADQSKLRYFSMSMQISREKKEYYRILESTQRGDGDITAWLVWYLECLGRAVEASESMLSGVLNKAMFWKTFSAITVTGRQREVLNTYLDGYEGKLTAKNWAKLAGVSLDTAGRDIRDLVSKGMLSQVQGRVRDVSYTINYVAEDAFLRHFSSPEIVQRDGKDYITAFYKDTKKVEERMSDIDRLRLKQKELSLNDLLYKYFAYLTDHD